MGSLGSAMAFVHKLIEMGVFNVFLVIGLGMWVGSFKFRNFSLGAAGVLFVALFFGHITKQEIPKDLTDLGLMLFVYAVGLQAGPRFFGIFKKRGKSFLLVGVGTTLVGALATIALAYAFHFQASMATGLYAGATTCTPALAAGLDVINLTLGKIAGIEAGRVASVGYGVAYPFSVFFVVVLVQLLPSIYKLAPQAAADQARKDEQSRTPGLVFHEYEVTNEDCAGKTLDQFRDMRISDTVISRIRHDGVVSAVMPNTKLAVGDVIRAVGTEVELKKLEEAMGHQVGETLIDPTGELASQEVVVSRGKVVGRSLRELGVWEKSGVVCTRVRREGLEFTPTGDLVLELGDVLRAVGNHDDVEGFAARVGKEERRLDETSLVPFAGGIALGILVGMIPIPLGGGLVTRLGTAGGAFIVGLLLGHLGHLGPMRVYVPGGAKMLCQELGLVIFLAGAGSGAGIKFASIMRTTGPQLLLAGALITLASSLFAVFVMHRIMKWNMLSVGGAVSACMTNPPGLGAANNLVASDAQAIGFASMYPVAIISKILAAQAIFLVVRLFAH